MIQKYKIENEIDEIDCHFKPIYRPVRTDDKGKYQNELIKDCDQPYNFFNTRIASKWNELPNEIIKATSLYSFKKSWMFTFAVIIQSCHSSSSAVHVPFKGLVPFATQLLLKHPLKAESTE